MNITLFVIGDEILSGKRQDKHLAKVIELLAARGMALSAAEFLGDDQIQIATAIARVVARGDLLLSCGGIGATPDDCTRQGAALAFQRPLERHPEGLQLIEAQYGERAYPHRVIMVEFPQGAGLIPNPINRVPGFQVGDAHFVPGFPEMAWPMLEWVLDIRYPQLHNAEPPVEYSLRAYDAAEGDLLTLMEETLAAHRGLKLSSLPFRSRPDMPSHIEFGFKGPQAQAASAYRAFAQALAARALRVEALTSP
ncbi:MAG: molybdopterin-binding protein [Stagnimonas sp.]|nr:molybdopterin-binding protein [Stagnimonas sp.]